MSAASATVALERIEEREFRMEVRETVGVPSRYRWPEPVAYRQLPRASAEKQKEYEHVL